MFVEVDPSSCLPHHSSFNFMKHGCMKSCNICGQKVSITLLQYQY